MKINMTIDDETDFGRYQDGRAEDLQTHLLSILENLSRRVENLAVRVATSSSAYTEQGILHTAFCNGVIKSEGEAPRAFVMQGDMSAARQISTAQQIAEETYQCILANKPSTSNVLIWRTQPELERALTPVGLSMKIYCRLSWEVARV